MSSVRLKLNALSDCKYIPNECPFEDLINAYLYKTKEKTVANMVIELCTLSSAEVEQVNELDEIEDWCRRDTTESISYTPLDAFVKCNGLIVLAERLPIIIPFIHEPLLNISDKDQRFNSNENSSNLAKTSPDFVDYVIMNDTDEPFDDDIYVIGGNQQNFTHLNFKPRQEEPLLYRIPVLSG
jgi:hypothetical protein